MYSLLLLLCVVLLLLSPLGLDLWLSVREARAYRRRFMRVAKAKGPGIAWASPRLH